MREVIVMKSNSWMKTLLPSVGLAICLLFSASASAHCDSFDGPIIPEALEALEDGEVQPLLKWVEPEHEEEIIAAFERARNVSAQADRKSTRLNSSHVAISYAVFCLKKKNN